jgi:colanic acid biosynthesis glycosyl transferase WcaI
MRINIISSVFYPEPMVSARTSHDLACELALKGHIVLVVTSFPSRPAGKLYEGYRRRLRTRERAPGGYDILRLFSFFSGRSSLVSRFLENLSFGIATILAVAFHEKPDVVYANTWPIFAQGSLALACKLRGIPLVLSIQDLYPESLYVQKRGIEKTSWLYRLLHDLDSWIARNCAGLIVISETFKETYVCDRRIAENKITVIPNWIDDIQDISSVSGVEIRKMHDIPNNAFLVVYGGNIGVAAGVESLIDAFRYLSPEENIYLLVAGAGNSLSNCLQQIQTHKLKNVKIHSPWPASETFTVLSVADLCILPTQGEQSLVSVPSKLLTYMMAGRCVLALASAESETARLITKSGAGWVISACDSRTLGNSIYNISILPIAERQRRGQAGHRFVVENFAKRATINRVVELLVQ